MATLNFGTLNTTPAVSTTSHRLKPWDIYKVKFAGARVDHIQGKKDPSMTYDILKVRFEGEDGYFEESIFFPKEEDAIRPKATNREGHEYERPSNFERTMTFIAQVATVLNEAGFKKMQAASGKFKSFDDVCKAFVAVTDSAKGKETNLKLIGKTDKSGNVTAILPYFTGVNKDGELFVSDNFIGDKLFFSTYEEQKKAEFMQAKPTDMQKVVTDTTNVSSTKGSEEDIDFSELGI